jgi:hypothetical protein
MAVCIQVNWAYDRDSTPQSLAEKNDDGHTAMWNAAAAKGKRHIEPTVAQPATFYGEPKFFAHSTGWVDDYSVGRAMANGGGKSTGLSASGGARTTKLLQNLWNAGSNDEITSNNVGHLHPSEMHEIQKLSPEYSKINEITTEKHMDYHPLKWMMSQQDPSAIQRPDRDSKLKAKTSMLAQKGLFEKLWNAAADDEIGGDPSVDEPGHLSFSPRKWLRNQQDEAEMAELHPRNGKRMFAGVQDHELNSDGAFVNDNSIGVHVSEKMHKFSSPRKHVYHLISFSRNRIISTVQILSIVIS